MKIWFFVCFQSTNLFIVVAVRVSHFCFVYIAMNQRGTMAFWDTKNNHVRSDVKRVKHTVDQSKLKKCWGQTMKRRGRQWLRREGKTLNGWILSNEHEIKMNKIDGCVRLYGRLAEMIFCCYWSEELWKSLQQLKTVTIKHS